MLTRTDLKDRSAPKPAKLYLLTEVELLWSGGIFYQKIAQYDTAIEYFERILELNPTTAHSFTLAQVRERCASVHFEKEESLYRSTRVSWFFSTSRKQGNAQLASLFIAPLPMVHYGSIDVHPDVLGSGRFGRVHLGQIKKRTSPVAVKCLVTNNSLNEQSPGWYGLVHELVIHADLAHPNIVSLIAICTSPLHPCLVFEYMNLCSLDKCLQNKSHVFGASDKARIKEGVVGAVAYLHSKNIAHNAIKAGHVLLNRSATQLDAKLTDFGDACKVNDVDFRPDDVRALASLLIFLDGQSSQLLASCLSECKTDRPTVNDILVSLSQDHLVSITI